MHENSGLDPAGAGGGIPAKAGRGGAMEHMATRWAMRGRKPKSSLDAVLASASAISSHRSPVAAPSEESIERHSGGAPTELGWTRVRPYRRPGRQQRTWMAQNRNLEIPGMVHRTIPERRNQYTGRHPGTARS